ncbi:hypothetical protein LEP1GSC170_1460 [Leptospira interrogans serovar Bataviae str. HAI135]|nr:hypothetical protein LEP1GSC170_1460 [Leptospira interrogans serovar Bataviae str. HAI135]
MIATIERLGKKYTIEAIADKVAQKKPDQLTRVDASKVATACKEIINRLKNKIILLFIFDNLSYNRF